MKEWRGLRWWKGSCAAGESRAPTPHQQGERAPSQVHSAHSLVAWKRGEGNEGWVEQERLWVGVYHVACNGPGEPPSSTCTGTDEFLPHSLGLGSQSKSTGIFLLWVWVFLRSYAPSLPWQTCQTQVRPCQDAPKALWEVWICTVGVGGTMGWGEVGQELFPSQAESGSS